MASPDNDDPDIEAEARSLIRRALDEGSEIVGGMAGAGAGFLLEGPVGAMAGASLGTFMTHRLRAAGAEVLNRYLSPRERKRVGAVLASAAKNMKEKLERGELPRQDGFFDRKIADRSSADEIIEGVIIAAQREHEERKIPFMGRLLANIAFDETVTREQANLVIRTASQLSYNALCIMFVAQKSAIDLHHLSSYSSHIIEKKNETDHFATFILTEIKHLDNLGVMEAGDILSSEAFLHQIQKNCLFMVSV